MLQRRFALLGWLLLRPPFGRAARIGARASALAVALVCALGLRSGAWANRRFPRADQLVAAPGQPELLVLRATFGVLGARGGGAARDWSWEEASGFSGEEDPAIALLAGGRLLAGISAGLAQVSGDYCAFQFAALSGTPVELVDLTLRPREPGSAVALAWERSADANVFGYRSRFFSTSDAGGTWRPQGAGIDPGVLVLTVDVAPSDARRLYASGIRPAARSAALFVSTDAGETWAERG